jgi:hypothetical protein
MTIPKVELTNLVIYSVERRIFHTGSEVLKGTWDVVVLVLRIVISSENVTSKGIERTEVLIVHGIVVTFDEVT